MLLKYSTDNAQVCIHHRTTKKFSLGKSFGFLQLDFYMLDAFLMDKITACTVSCHIHSRTNTTCKNKQAESIKIEETSR